MREEVPECLSAKVTEKGFRRLNPYGTHPLIPSLNAPHLLHAKAGDPANRGENPDEILKMEIIKRRYKGKYILYSTSMKMYYRHPFWVYENCRATRYDKEIIDKALKAVMKQEMKLEKAFEEAKQRRNEHVKLRILSDERTWRYQYYLLP